MVSANLELSAVIGFKGKCGLSRLTAVSWPRVLLCRQSGRGTHSAPRQRAPDLPSGHHYRGQTHY